MLDDFSEAEVEFGGFEETAVEGFVDAAFRFAGTAAGETRFGGFAFLR